MSRDHFNTRSQNNNRIESLSDGVFALSIAISLISGSPPENYDELLQFVFDIVPFGLSILFIFWVWHEQKNYFRRFGLYDQKSKNLNLLLLFFVLFYTYPLKFLMTWIINFFSVFLSGKLREQYSELNEIVPFTKVSELMVIYGFGFIAVFGCLFLLYSHAESKKDYLKLSKKEELETRMYKKQFLTSVVIGIISILTAVSGIVFEWQFAAFFSGIIYNLIWILGIYFRK